MESQLSDEKAEKIGMYFIDLLQLKVIKQGPSKGRVHTGWGTKTPQGVARIIERVLSEIED